MSNAHNLFDTRRQFDLGNGQQGALYSLPQLEKAGVGPVSRLPVSIRLVLESVLRNCDGKRVSEQNVRALANWIPNASRTYLMGRSQPPFLSSFILDVYHTYKLDKRWLERAIKIAQAEYQTVWLGTTKPNARMEWRIMDRYSC